MRRVVVGEQEVDRCLACGALWFDRGEIRELTEGRLAVDDGGEIPPDPPGGALRRLHGQAASLACPRCGGRVGAIDFQMTGIPLLHCRKCLGYLVPRRFAAALSERFRFTREHGEEYARLGETMAATLRKRMEREHGPVTAPSGMPIPLPVVMPLADEGPAVRTFPVVTWFLVGLTLGVYLFARLGGGSVTLPGGHPGLPSGAGFQGFSLVNLLLSPFLHAGILPLAAGILFLLVLGDNVEDRMGWLPFLVLYLSSGVVAGAAHVLRGTPGAPAALGSAGAVADVLGAYLVFFPEVSIEMYGLGRVASVPAYLFACFWVAASFLIGPGPLTEYLNPAPLSLAGNMAGFGTGVLLSIFRRAAEERRIAPGADA